MPEITAVQIAILAGTVAAGAVIGWLTRGSRCAQEKVAVNEGWQQQLEAQRTEHDRLLRQNKTLMEQISQLQASAKDGTNRARELSSALKEAFERRDALQRDLKEIRSNLERAVRQRDQLQADMKTAAARGDSAQGALKDKDDKIFRLSRELENWQNRLPPLIERYRERDQEVQRLAHELELARTRIGELEDRLNASETRIEPVDPEALGDDFEASNDPTNITYTGLADVLHEDDDATEFAEAVVDRDEQAETGTATDDDASPPLATGLSEYEVYEDFDERTASFETLDDTGAGATEDSGYGADSTAYDAGDDAEDDVEDDTADDERTAALRSLRESEPGGLRDNLRLIKGIGPAIEKTLNELGIFRFHQIAEMSEYDIDRVAQRLKGFRSRIYREDWVGQARDLQLRKSGT